MNRNRSYSLWLICVFELMSLVARLFTALDILKTRLEFSSFGSKIVELETLFVAIDLRTKQSQSSEFRDVLCSECWQTLLLSRVPDLIRDWEVICSHTPIRYCLSLFLKCILYMPEMILEIRKLFVEKCACIVTADEVVLHNAFSMKYSDRVYA